MQITFRVDSVPVAQPDVDNMTKTLDTLAMNAKQRRINAIKAASSPRWTKAEIDALNESYPRIGKLACAKLLNRTEAEIRYKAASIGLRLDRTSEFYKSFQAAAGITKRGRKRPDQSIVMKGLHEQGKLLKSPDQKAAISVRMKKWIRLNGHPRGALGLKHTPDTISKIAEASSKAWLARSQRQKQTMKLKASQTRAANNTPFNTHGLWKAGWRVVGGQRVYFRSRWEANYGRYLEWLKSIGNIKGWEHEPETFWFGKVRRGTVSYLPDFRITNNDGSIEYHEVKGWMDARSKTKLKRMAKYYPTVKLVLIDSKCYKKLANQIKACIADWE